MTKDDIIRMAREAGFEGMTDHPALMRFANLVAAHKAEVALAEAYRCGVEAGADELRRLHHNSLVLTNALWKACGDDEELVNATIESQGEMK